MVCFATRQSDATIIGAIMVYGTVPASGPQPTYPNSESLTDTYGGYVSDPTMAGIDFDPTEGARDIGPVESSVERESDALDARTEVSLLSGNVTDTEGL